jgi:hypothetical protein
VTVTVVPDTYVPPPSPPITVSVKPNGGFGVLSVKTAVTVAFAAGICITVLDDLGFATTAPLQVEKIFPGGGEAEIGTTVPAA